MSNTYGLAYKEEEEEPATVCCCPSPSDSCAPTTCGGPSPYASSSGEDTSDAKYFHPGDVTAGKRKLPSLVQLPISKRPRVTKKKLVRHGINYVTFQTESGRSIPLDCRYTDVKVIGTGSYGTVLRARDTHTMGTDSEEVAVKHTVLVEDKLDVDDWPDIVRIIREVELLRDFHHNNILSLVDIFPQPPAYAMTSIGIVTPLYKGGTLATYQPRSLAQVMAFTRQVLSALAFMHGHNVLHRDVKRDNIFVSKDGSSVVLGDFGLARAPPHALARLSTPYQSVPGDRISARSSTTATAELMTTRIVTAPYRAPELLLNHDDYDGRIDVYATGCVLTELIFAPGNGRSHLFKHEDTNNKDLEYQYTRDCLAQQLVMDCLLSGLDDPADEAIEDVIDSLCDWLDAGPRPKYMRHFRGLTVSEDLRGATLRGSCNVQKVREKFAIVQARDPGDLVTPILRSLLTFDPRERPQSEEVLLEFDEIFNTDLGGSSGPGQYNGPLEDDLEAEIEAGLPHSSTRYVCAKEILWNVMLECRKTIAGSTGTVGARRVTDIFEHDRLMAGKDIFHIHKLADELSLKYISRSSSPSAG
ncbi:Mitogen-activated protein kinase [Perkinsus chesapeaki]|uniref:Mitogen-activated protein kinase n=1 Tax=Perkinsus chesapeaki TaxID=330153 RepID=A0A7J6LJQ1_PERCH|nr:Mitogen-activated protein kinase [Perkinsus chesapeaki]